MESVKKMNLSTIEDRLSMYEMQQIQAGSGFCTGWGVTAGVYEAGVLLNAWNPIGWGGQAILVGAGLYCAFH